MELGHSLARIAGRLLHNIHAGDAKLAIHRLEAPGELSVRSSSFAHGGPIPARHAGDRGVAPALAWHVVPVGTKEIAVLCEDPDAPLPKPFVHWLVHGLPPDAQSIPEGTEAGAWLAGGAMQGKNSTGRTGYVGPKPPVGHGLHHYHFQVFALRERLGLPSDVDRDALVRAMFARVLAKGELVGTYQRE